jgi:hypothetical protein
LLSQKIKQNKTKQINKTTNRKGYQAKKYKHKKT